ncbi:type II toxin-antitoxin system HicB family antitoxin [Terrarubrum flagellatum]|uniref:type II toxin-antitoxin system HicB family antitoxin n=1 Tax=Terrirubrum flagellatum TaxID=2895980 RepID=UPI00314566F1
MRHFLAILEDAGPNHAVGVWFPDVPGCFSAGDTFDEALVNAREALASHLALLRSEGAALPSPRTIEELKRDSEVAGELKDYIVAAVDYDEAAISEAAE